MMSINLRTTEKGDNHLCAIPCGLAVCIKKKKFGCVQLSTIMLQISMRLQLMTRQRKVCFLRDLYKNVHNLKELSIRQ